MIVYTGKQYGNEFNNGDEALFQDANRPRDEDKFQIRPGFNARKNDLRTANSGIAAQATYYGLKNQAGQTSLTDTSGNWLFNKAYLKSSYTASDVSDCVGFTTAGGKTYTADELYPYIKGVVIGRPQVNPYEGDIVIGKSGLYAVTAQCTFIAPTGYNVNNTANYKFYVALLGNGVPVQYTQSRGCGAMDSYYVFYMGRFDTGDRVNTGFLHTYTTRSFLCEAAIDLYRLS